MSEAVPGQDETQALPLDFSGAVLLAHPQAPLASDATDAELEAPVVPAEESLVAHSFGDRALLLPSMGAARRILLETIRARHRLVGRPKRRRLLVCTGGAPLPPEFAADAEVEAMSDDLGSIAAAIGPDTAGLFVAPLRRDGGLETLSGAFLAELRQGADEYGLALVFDETDAGIGRTGMAFAHEWTGVTPDLMLVGEGSGLPAAALVLTDKFVRGLPASRPEVPEADRARAGEMLAAVFAEGFEGRIQSLGWALEDHLARLRYGRPDLFTGMVGTGLVQGLVCAGPADALAERLAAAGLLVRAVGEVLALLPPLDASEAEIAAAMGIMGAMVAETVPAPA